MTRSKKRPTLDPSKAVAYLRVSTEDQALGPEAQRASIEAWAARQGIEVATWHTDQGISVVGHEKHIERAPVRV